MNSERLLILYDRVFDAPNAIPRLRRFILDLAVRGRLVWQDMADEPASELLERIAKEKARRVKEGESRSPRPIPPPSEPPFPIPANWAWSQIAELGLLNPRNDAPDDLPTSFVPMPMIAAEFGVANEHQVRPWGDIKKGYTHFAEGDVGLAKITPCFENGKSTVFRDLTGRIGSGTTELHTLRPVFVNPTYILLFLKSPHFIETGISKMTGTAGQKRVSIEYFAHSPFPLPPLPEQHRVVAKVDELMALCGRLEAARTTREAARNRLSTASHARLNAPDLGTFQSNANFALGVLRAVTTRPDQIKQLRSTILDLAVRGRLVPQILTDEPASELLVRVEKQIAAYSRANRIGQTQPEPMPGEPPFPAPPGWQWARLCTLFNVITDGDHQPPPKADNGVAFLTIGNITSGILDFEGCRLVPEAYYQSLARYRTPEKGDILYTVVGATYGRPALVETDRPFCVQRHIAIFKPVDVIDRRFLLLVLASPLIYNQASKSTTGSAQPTIALRPLRNFVAPIPPVAEQRRIVAKVDELMALCDDLEKSLTTVERGRSHLLNALLLEALAPIELDKAA
jgi:type I restriction enzyme S subunit